MRICGNGLSLLAAVVATGVFISADQCSAAELYADPALIGHWPLDEGSGQVASDASSNSLNLQLGSTSGPDDNDPSWAPLGVGFRAGDLITSSVDRDPLDFDAGDAFTLAASVKRPASAPAGMIMSKSGGAPHLRGWSLSLRSGSRQLEFILRRSQSNPNNRRLYVRTKPGLLADLSEWTHLAVTYDGSADANGVAFYVDGQLVPGYATTDNLEAADSTVNDRPFNIGGRNDAGSYVGGIRDVAIWGRAVSASEIGAVVSPPGLALEPKGAQEIPIPTVDISGETNRHVIIAQGTEEIYQGHATTVLLDDGKTLFAVWSYEHGGPCGALKKSTDGGRTWSELLPVPANWKDTHSCPAIYRLIDPRGKERLMVFACKDKPGEKRIHMMWQAISEDKGKTWSEMKDMKIECVMPFCWIELIQGGKKYLAVTNERRPTYPKPRFNRVVQWISSDGGLTWSDERVICDVPNANPCEPVLVRSPNGRQLLCLMRVNNRKINSLFIVSNDEGRSWSLPKEATASLTGDRHAARYGPDGRLVICFRDRATNSPSKNHYAAWVGRYEDIVSGREGQYRIKLLHSHAGSDCGYAALELLPDGDFLSTTYIKYREGPERQSVVSTRFNLAEMDAKVELQRNRGHR